ncbi:MAG TPA: translation elongation factor Ts [Eubacteriales bacterium]|jgi:elongation factor Ts|nr:translation elongation factor Ts [Clostridia bacterium]HRR89422.1 translation elongation factor Ts [Eubacteriales bacterium]HRU84440.1 translation elongation factor Ts [Eubacteriales bacterium]
MAFTNKDVMELRAKTDAGVMDCKRALIETDGNMDAAVKYLREQGILKADKKATRIAAEGIVDSYIHMGGKIGVLVEVNCETDFVAKSDKFKELVHNIAMQIAAAKPLYLAIEDVPASVIESEREIARAQELKEEKPKPAAVIEKIVEGKIKKFYKDVCLLEQVYVRDSSKTISQLVSETIALIGEKISIRRFARFEMGEGLQKKADTFADEIAEQLNKIK